MKTLARITVFAFVLCSISIGYGAPSFSAIGWNIENGVDMWGNPYTKLLGVRVDFSLDSITEIFHADVTHDLYLDDFEVGIDFLPSPSQMGHVYLGNPPDPENYVDISFYGAVSGRYSPALGEINTIVGIGSTNTNPLLTGFVWDADALRGTAIFGNPVPAPGAMLLCSLGCLLVGSFRRRFNR